MTSLPTSLRSYNHMSNNIKFLDENILSLHKPLWHPEHLLLANRLCFDEQPDPSGIYILIDLRTCARKALMEFLKAAFHDVVTADIYSDYRTELYRQVKERYDAIRLDFYQTCITKATYHLRLRPYQLDGLVQMAHKKTSLLAYEMGTGKTISSISLSVALQIRRTIIICPASVKWSFFEDLTGEWGFNPLYFTILDSEKRKCTTAFQERFVIVNYDIVEKFMPYLLSTEAGHIIIDECHKIKEVSTKRYKSVEKLIHSQPNARVTMMTGTPIANRPNDVFALFRLANLPLGQNQAAFLREFTKSKVNRGKIQVTGGLGMDKLNVALSNFMIRKTKKECLKDMPALTITKHIIRDEEYKDEYNRIIEEMMNPENQGGATLNGSMHSLNRLMAMAKLRAAPGIIDLIDDLIEAGEKIVVFSFYKNVLTSLEDHYKEKCAVVHGGVSTSNRHKAVERFMKDEECSVFIGQTDAAGVGINGLQYASSYIVVCDIPFTPTQLDQALSRLHRGGQDSPVTAYIAMVEGDADNESIDQILFQLVANKAADISIAIDGGNPSVDYGNIGEELFNKLVTNYKKTHPVTT